MKNNKVFDRVNVVLKIIVVNLSGDFHTRLCKNKTPTDGYSRNEIFRITNTVQLIVARFFTVKAFKKRQKKEPKTGV